MHLKNLFSRDLQNITSKKLHKSITFLFICSNNVVMIYFHLF